MRFEMSQNHDLEALHNDRCQCYWTVIIKATDDGLLQKWGYYRRLQAGWYDGLGQGLVKDLCIFFSILPGMLSGPAAFLGFTALSVHLTSRSSTVRMWLL